MERRVGDIASAVNRALFLTIVVFAFFDGIRSNIIIGNYLTVVRELVTIYLIGVCLVSITKIKLDVIKFPLLAFMTWHTIICLLSIVQEGPITWSFIVKPYEFVGIIYAFYYYREMTNKNYSYLIRQIIIIAIVFGCLNVFLYLIPLPIWNRADFWWGRVSCGYPTMDVISLCYALVLLLFYKKIGFKLYVKIIFAVLISLFVILNFSGTGTVLLLSILSLSMLINRSRRIAFPVVTICLGLFFVSAGSIKQLYPEEFDRGMVLLETKYKNLSGDETASANTLDIRKQQYEKNLRRIEDSISELTGIGLNYASNDNEILKRYKYNAFMIENEYNLIRICYGYIGLILFCAFIVLLLYISILNRYTIGILGGGIFAANCFTLISLVLYPNYIFFALFYVLIIRYGYSIRQEKISIMYNNRQGFLGYFISVYLASHRRRILDSNKL